MRRHTSLVFLAREKEQYARLPRGLGLDGSSMTTHRRRAGVPATHTHKLLFLQTRFDQRGGKEQPAITVMAVHRRHCGRYGHCSHYVPQPRDVNRAHGPGQNLFFLP